MPAIAVNQPFPIFTDADGQPLDDAYIYIGTANQNPVSNPITVYWDSALTIPVSQPIRTSGGYPVYNGSPARFYANSDYSILVRDKNGAFVYSNNQSDLNLGQVGTLSNDPIVFYVNTIERMRLDVSGNLLISRTSAYSDGAIGTPVLQANAYTGVKAAFATIANSTSSTAAIGFVNPNGTVGSISTSGTSTSYLTSSDYRLKENIAPMTRALEKVAALKPVTYTWKSDGSDGEGFIAHELQEVCPLAVIGEKDAVDADGKPVHQGIDTSKLVGLLTAAIQELKLELDILKLQHAK